jgi:hypothetical protein
MWANSDTVAVEFEFEWMQNIVTNKELIVTNNACGDTVTEFEFE